MFTSSSFIWALWAVAAALVLCAVVITVYKRTKVTKIIPEGGRTVVEIRRTEEGEDIIMNIFYGPLDDRPGVTRYLDEIDGYYDDVPDEDPAYSSGTAFWSRVHDIDSVEDDDEAMAIAERLVEMGSLRREQIGEFLGLDAEGNRKKKPAAVPEPEKDITPEPESLVHAEEEHTESPEEEPVPSPGEAKEETARPAAAAPAPRSFIPPTEVDPDSIDGDVDGFLSEPVFL